MPKVLVCEVFDTATNTCTDESWRDQAVFPNLTYSETLELSEHIVFVLALAYIFRRLAIAIRGK